LEHKINDTQDSYQITPEMQSELPLAVRQLLNITEETTENEVDLSVETPNTCANTLLEETHVVTKTPVAVQQHSYPETEVGYSFACTKLHEICMNYTFVNL
jgi:hypothetical protein